MIFQEQNLHEGFKQDKFSDYDSQKAMIILILVNRNDNYPASIPQRGSDQQKGDSM